MHVFPVYGHIPAGPPTEYVNLHPGGTATIDELLLRFKPREGCFLLKVRGDSMKDAGILNGDLVLIEPTAAPRAGFGLAMSGHSGDNRRMISLTLDCVETESELLSAELWEHGASGIQEQELPGGRVRLQAWFDANDGLAERFAAYRPRVEDETTADWETLSRQAWQPVEVGARFYLAPEWDESPTPAGRMRLTVHPGMALGTGHHPATQLVLVAMEQHLRSGERILDTGTGTGILLQGAYLLGARGVGCDIEWESTRTARSNLLADACPPRVFAGSLRAVATGAADVVVANINAVTHHALAPEYARVARRLAILAGFPAHHVAGIERALGAQGWQPQDRMSEREWVCLVFSPR